MANKGLFFSFEGGEGAGKSTQTHLLASWLEKQGYKICLTREPGGTKGAELLRELLLFSKPDFSSRAEIAVHFAARLDHIDQVILPSLQKNEIVICDRFYDSTFAYQGYGMEKGDDAILQFIEKIHQLAALTPDATFLLDLPVEEGMKRARGRKEKIDRYEAETIFFHQRVREGYLKIAKSCPERISIMNALLPADEIQSMLRRKVTCLLGEMGDDLAERSRM